MEVSEPWRITRARPVTRGRKSQVWEGRILDEEERLVAMGRVRLLCFDADDGIAGGEARVPPELG